MRSKPSNNVGEGPIPARMKPIEALTDATVGLHDRPMRVIAALSIALVSAGCTRPNPGVCCVSPDDCHSIGADENERPCDMGLVCMDHMCTVPPAGCQLDTDCSGTTPFCAPDHSCVGCLQSDQCPTNAPTCDATTHACRACAIDDDCSSGVCDLKSGACVAESTILYASPTGSSTATCAKQDTCAIARAFALVSVSHNTVKLMPGSYTASIAIADKNVFVDGFGATVTAPNAAETFIVSGSTQLRMVGLTIVNPNSVSQNGTAVDCNGPNTTTRTLELDQVTIDSAYIPFAGLTCNLTLTRSRIHGLPGASYTLLDNGTGTATIDQTVFDGGDGVVSFGSGSSVHVTNSIFQNQSGPDGAFLGGSLFGAPTGAMFVSFSTVIHSTVMCGTGTPACLGGINGGSCIDSTVIYNPGGPSDTVTGTACNATYSIVFPQTTALSGANNKLGVDPLLADPSSGDYHLQLASPAIDAANPGAAATPDFDGTSRPQGTRSDMGAFEFKP